MLPLLSGQDDDTTGHLQKTLAQIGSFCLIAIGIFVVLEIIIFYSHFCYTYNILVLLISGIPIAMPMILSVTLVVGAQQLAKHKAIITAIENSPIDHNTIGPFSTDDVVLLAAYTSHTENQDAIDASIVQAVGDAAKARAGITLLDFKPFILVDNHTKITCREESTGKIKHVTKDMTVSLLNFALENRSEADVEEYASRGLCVLANAKETSCRLGLGDHMYPTRVLKDGPCS
ncbi:hypothetical protein VKT23_014075 [Stygiomarasmius scandens]|uniref:Uncharacterized protein n=1 Tax=Marasmiellus scandens TaxID=2682957 RepID=A0ABR1J180_9AGAR